MLEFESATSIFVAKDCNDRGRSGLHQAKKQSDSTLSSLFISSETLQITTSYVLHKRFTVFSQYYILQIFNAVPNTKDDCKISPVPFFQTLRLQFAGFRV